MQELIRPKRRNSEYTILVEVEFLHVGQALQQRPQAAEPQQQAIFAAQVAAEQTPKTAPISRKTLTKTFPVYREENSKQAATTISGQNLQQRHNGQR